MNSIDVTFIKRFLHSFKVLGGNEYGYINYNYFKSIIQKDNESKEILKIIEKECHIKKENLDFVSLCSSILTTKAYFNRLFKENGRVPNSFLTAQNPSVEQKQDKRGIITVSKKNFKKSLKGIIFNQEEDLLSYRYYLEVFENSKIEITTKAVSINGEHIPDVLIEVFILQDNNSKAFITLSTTLNNEGCCTIKCILRKGKYILVPVLLKPFICNNEVSDEGLKLDSLINIGENADITLTAACKKTLRTVFDAIDLDGNGLVNHLEFEYFVQYTTGETATEEWTAIEDNFATENGELTFGGFLEMYQLVLKTDPSDVLNMLNKMGMNNHLEFEKAQSYILSVVSDKEKVFLNPAPISSYVDLAKKIFCKVAIEQGSSNKMKHIDDLVLYNYYLPFRACLVLQNQSQTKMKVQLDCSKSTNCISHRKNLCYAMEIPPRTNMIGHHLFPVDTTQNMNVTCSAMLS